MSLPMRGEWIEIKAALQKIEEAKASLPMRGEWIEMGNVNRKIIILRIVSPHAGRVD